MPSPVYKTAFGAWPVDTMMRGKEVNDSTIDGVTGHHYPARLFPPVNHLLVVARGAPAATGILTNAFLCFADWQMVLEREAVDPAAKLIATAGAEIGVPLKMRMDASKILADEAVHAHYAQAQFAAVCATQGIEWLYLEKPRFVRRLQNVLARADATHRRLLELLFAAVVETLISSQLSEIPNDPSVLMSTREFVRLHAVDECRHHALFAQFIPLLWTHLTSAQREIVGPYVPKFMRWFLEPDIRNLDSVLVSQGFSMREIEAIIGDSFPQNGVDASMRQTAAKTISYFRRAGAFDVPAVADAFEALRLL